LLHIFLPAHCFKLGCDILRGLMQGSW
jgi:hypothetical protein